MFLGGTFFHAALRCRALFHPPFEQSNLFFGPRLVAGHTAVKNASVNLFRVSFDTVERRQIKTEILHHIHVRRVAEQRANVFSKAESHGSSFTRLSSRQSTEKAAC